MSSQKILILGAGELGTAITEALLNHHAFDAASISLTLAIRPNTLSALDARDTSSRTEALVPFRERGVLFTSCDLVADSEDDLSKLFAKYDSVVHAGAMTLPPGTQLKVTRAALAAKVDEYVAWQWGVDYDIIGPDGGLGLFSEQCEVRQLLRSQKQTKWYVVSCGVFMSFLFEDFWPVVVRDAAGAITGIRALGGWDHLITATTVEGIARCNAELMLVDKDKRNEPVYIAGDTMRYSDFADTVEKIVGHGVEREEWTTKHLIEESGKDPENKLLKYRVVFSEDRGLAWNKAGTFNDQKRIEMEGIEAYMKRMKMY